MNITRNSIYINAMKKIILHPKTDTVIICLPQKWVGVPIVCKLSPVYHFDKSNDESQSKIEKEQAFQRKATK